MALQISRVAIIGAGPTGLACVKYLLAEKYFTKIDVYEQRERVGGVWILSGAERSKRIPVPQTDPRYGSLSSDESSLEFESPLYDYLETNIPKTLMAYADTPFSEDLPLFPGHAAVLQYLEAYAEPIKSHIKFRTQVKDLHLVESDQRSREKWSVKAKSLETGRVSTEIYDAVIVANGHYTVPSIPSISGLKAWNESYPGTIIHSKAYRRPEDFANRKCLVIGNSASGVDVAAQLSSHAQHPVILASRSASQFTTTSSPTWRRDVSEIVEFLSSTDGNRAVKTKSGEIINDIDAVIFATGYFYSYPFLSGGTTNLTTSEGSSRATSPDSSSDKSESSAGHPEQGCLGRDKSLDLVISGFNVNNTYAHFLHTTHPTLALPVLNLKIIPFPLAENQAAVIARLWSNRLSLPSSHELAQWRATEEAHLNVRPNGSGLHTLTFPQDIAQLNWLYSWAASARPNPNLQNNGTGKLGRYCNEYTLWLRSQIAEMKAAFNTLSPEQKRRVKSVEDLPRKFRFEDWDVTRDEEKYGNLLRRANIET